jgi:RNA polymerase sigma factor (sigma-70 family)
MDTLPAVDAQIPSALDLPDLVGRVQPGLLRAMRSVTRDPEVAEDISQDALLRLTSLVVGGRVPDDPAAWLFRVAYNLAVSRGRRLATARRRSAVVARRDPPATVEEQAVERERSALMTRLFAELDPADQRILSLSAAGHPGRQVSASVGLSHAAYRSRIHRLRRRLQARLADLDRGTAGHPDSPLTTAPYHRRGWTHDAYPASVARRSSRVSTLPSR